MGQRVFYIALGAVIVIGVALFLSSRSGATGISIPANTVVMPADTTGFRGYIVGSESAPIEISEYADFTCPYCANFDAVSWPDIKQRLIDAGTARFRFREFPLSNEGEHRWARTAAHAAACTADQGKYWEAKSAIFASQRQWIFAKDAVPGLSDAVKSVGVDIPKWTECMKSAKYAGRIEASYLEGNKLGVNSTPTFLIGGRLYTADAIAGADGFVKLVDSVAALAKPSAPAHTTPVGGQ